MALSSGCNNGNCNISIARHLSEFIGKTVTIFTTSGVVSGCGFTGCIISVNSCFVRLLTDLGSAPSCPIQESCQDSDGKSRGLLFDGIGTGIGGSKKENNRKFGSICDIPIDRIAAFCHNTM